MNVSKPAAILSGAASLGLASFLLTAPARAEAVLRTAACSTLSHVTYGGRDYAIRAYALRHTLEWKNVNEEFDLQLHEELSDTFPPFATVVRDLVREAKGDDGRERSGSETAQVHGVYGTDPGPVTVPTRDYSYDWTTNDTRVRTDEVNGKVVGRYRVTKRKISEDVELIRQTLLEAPKGGEVAPNSQETSYFRFKQPRWMWSALVPAPLEAAAAAFDPLVYAVDNAWTQLKACRAAKGTCDSLDKIYLRAVEARDKAWNDEAALDKLRDVGRKPDARGFAFTRFPEDVQVDEQGWLVLDQGSGYLNYLGDKTDGANLIAPADAMQKILEQQQMLARGTAAEARAEPEAAKPEAPQPAMAEARSSESHQGEAQAANSPVAEAVAPSAAKIHSARRTEAKSARHAQRERLAAARVQRAERRPRPWPTIRVVRAPEDDFYQPMMPVRPWLPPPPQYEVRVRRDVSPFYFLFE